DLVDAAFEAPSGSEARCRGAYDPAVSATADLASGPPFAIRARIITPLPGGRTRDVADGIVEVDATGRISSVLGAADAGTDRLAAVADLRPWVVLPGMVDLH